jgi:hypothetical protein
MAYHWSISSSKSSSSSSSTFVTSLISLQGVVLRYLIILRRIILWLCGIVLWLCSVILLWHSVIWCWYFVKLWCIFPIIISYCTLYVFDVISLISSIVLQSLSSWPTDLQKLQCELLGISWYFCIIGQWYGSCSYVLQTSHHIPPICSGFGSPIGMYYAKVGHSLLWFPSILHVVHQTSYLFSLLLFWFN